LTRTPIAIAAALFVAVPLFGAPAKACISCDYVPPVVNTPVQSHSQERAAPRREPRSHEARESRETKKQRVIEKAEKSEKPAKAKAKTAKSERNEKPAKTETAAKTSPPAADAEVENSSFARVGTAPEPHLATTVTPGDKGSEEHSTIATASVSGSKAVEAATVDEKVTNVAPTSGPATCSRYFPTVGQTLRVPCAP
jgi:hypothetical protein